MAISRLTGQDAAGSSTTTAVSATYTATPTSGNTSVAFVYANVNTGNTTITGWTLQQSGMCGSSATNGSVHIFTKVAGASESTTVTANATGGSVMRIQIYEYSGVAITSPVDGTPGAANSAATAVLTQSAGTTATSNANDLLLAVWGFNSATSAWSVDSSFTLRQTNGRMAGADQVVSATGTYAPTLSWTGSTRAGGVVLALKAAAPTPTSQFLIMF